nr:COX assembly mitochondrial protein homolog [Onthophagus taurus]
MSEYTVLPSKYSGGPHGLGDPDDRSLRKVEIEVMIPKKMREIAKTEKCTEEVKQFSECCKNHNVLMVINCQKQNGQLKDCLTKWYNDDDFKMRCREEYLKDRSQYRRTGVPVNQQKQRLPVSM